MEKTAFEYDWPAYKTTEVYFLVYLIPSLLQKYQFAGLFLIYVFGIIVWNEIILIRRCRNKLVSIHWYLQWQISSISIGNIMNVNRTNDTKMD